MKVITAHDAYTQYGGAERVFEAIHELYPEAPVYTIAVDEKNREHLKSWKVISSPLQTLYKIYPHLQHLFPFIPVMLKFFKTESADLLISSSSSYIKGLRKPQGCKHINYCHTPFRLLWTDQGNALKEIWPVLHPLAKLYWAWLRKWDYAKAQQVDFFIANSKEVQKRIKQFYKRDSEIIYPFVDVNFWKPTRGKQDYFLIAGRLQRAKGLEKVIAAFNSSGKPLHVVGSGRYEAILRAMSKPNIIFLGRLSDEDLRDEYSGARAFIFPQLEDFGIMPLEAAACGTATLGLNQGGTLETIKPGITGELFAEGHLESALSEWNESRYTKEALLAQAQAFSKELFMQKFKAFVQKIS